MVNSDNILKECINSLLATSGKYIGLCQPDLYTLPSWKNLCTSSARQVPGGLHLGEGISLLPRNPWEGTWKIHFLLRPLSGAMKKVYLSPRPFKHGSMTPLFWGMIPFLKGHGDSRYLTLAEEVGICCPSPALAAARLSEAPSPEALAERKGCSHTENLPPLRFLPFG